MSIPGGLGWAVRLLVLAGVPRSNHFLGAKARIARVSWYRVLYLVVPSLRGDDTDAAPV